MKFVMTGMVLGLLVTTAVVAAPPGPPAPTGYTLDQLYNYAAHGIPAVEGGHSLDPGTPPGTPMKSTRDLYQALTQLVPYREVVSGTQDVTLYVHPNGNDQTGDGSAVRPFRTVQRAVNAVPLIVRANYTIQLSAGVYREEVQIVDRWVVGGKTLVLQGLTGNPSLVRITGTDNDIASVRQYGIVALRTNNLIIRGLRVNHCLGEVLHIEFCDNALIDRCQIDLGASVGVRISNYATATVRDTTIQTSGVGLVVNDQSTATLEGSEVSASVVNGVQVRQGSRCTLTNSHVRGSGAAGIRIARESVVRLDGGSVANNTGRGVEVTQHSSLYSGCSAGATVIERNSVGIYVERLGLVESASCFSFGQGNTGGNTATDGATMGLLLNN